MLGCHFSIGKEPEMDSDKEPADGQGASNLLSSSLVVSAPMIVEI